MCWVLVFCPWTQNAYNGTDICLVGEGKQWTSKQINETDNFRN